MNIVYKILFLFSSVLLGFIVPLAFSALEVWKTQGIFDYELALENILVDNYHTLTTIFFPLISLLVGSLFVEIKSRKTQLKQEIEYLSLVLNASPDGIIFINNKLEPTFENNKFKALGIDLKRFISDIELQNIISQGSKVIQKEVKIDTLHMKDHPFFFNFRLTQFEGKASYFIGLKDLRTIKEREEIIEHQKELMIEKNKLASLGEMAAGIAHEINNPLMVICGNNDLIFKLFERNKMTLEKAKDLTDVVQKNIDRISLIINSLRNLSRGMANVNQETFPINQIIEEAINLAKIKSKFIDIKYINEVEYDLDVYGHQGQIVQVVLNLLNNAIDAISNQENPWIKFEAEVSDLYLNLYISDSGDPIAQETVDKMFLPLFTTKEIGKGTGLGLSLSKTFMAHNGGDLQYVDSENHTCFKVTILLANKEETSKAA